VELCSRAQWRSASFCSSCRTCSSPSSASVASEAADQDAADLAQAGIGGLVAKAVGGASDLSGFSRITALLVGLFALFFGAALEVLRIVYGLVWGVSPPKLKKTTGPILAVLGLTTVALAFIGVLDGFGERSFLLRLVGLVVSSVVPFVVALVASIYLPRQPTRWPELVPGGCSSPSVCSACTS
jgi:hypothetical protein